MNNFNVLSLFDGISCGQLALQRAGIKVSNYFASEIDSNAIKITQLNFPNTIQLGSVVDLNVNKLPKIDLLLGGSPCTGFSFSGKQLNFDDDQSKLFFEYVRILNEINPKYFLFENVCMKKLYSDVITKYLKVNPIEINSKYFSKQIRRRLYWTNIQIPYFEKNTSNNNFNNWLYVLKRGYYKEEIKFFEKYPTLLAQSPASKHRIIVDLEKAANATSEQLRKDLTITRPATPEECEEFQTLPIGYTNIVPKTHRYKSIGNGWTVDVIVHILKGIDNNNINWW